MTDQRTEEPAKSTVRYRPEDSPYNPARGWEAKCHRPGCADPFGWTWHLNWWHAMGRAWAHLRTCPAIALEHQTHWVESRDDVVVARQE